MKVEFTVRGQMVFSLQLPRTAASFKWPVSIASRLSDDLFCDGCRRWQVRMEDSFNRILIIAQQSMVLCRKVPHAAVSFQAHHLNGPDTPVLGHCEHTYKQRISYPDILPVRFDRERSFRR